MKRNGSKIVLKCIPVYVSTCVYVRVDNKRSGALNLIPLSPVAREKNQEFVTNCEELLKNKKYDARDYCTDIPVPYSLYVNKIEDTVYLPFVHFYPYFFVIFTVSFVSLSIYKPMIFCNENYCQYIIGPLHHTRYM